MRKIVRAELAAREKKYLARKQSEVNGGEEVESTWTRARKTKTMGRVLRVLEKMSGDRFRCMFCSDSQGTDIEHFRPKCSYPEFTFIWENLLLACAGCNRRKGNRFDLDESGQPLLIDPCADDPWDYLFYDSFTGFVTARYYGDGTPDAKGKHTSRPDVLPLNVEAVINGRKRTQRLIVRAVERCMVERNCGVSLSDASETLYRELKDCDDYGLLRWYFVSIGQDERPFCALKEHEPLIWDAVVTQLDLS